MKLGAKVCAPCNRLSQLQNLTSICKQALQQMPFKVWWDSQASLILQLKFVLIFMSRYLNLTPIHNVIIMLLLQLKDIGNFAGVNFVANESIPYTHLQIIELHTVHSIIKSNLAHPLKLNSPE